MARRKEVSFILVGFGGIWWVVLYVSSNRLICEHSKEGHSLGGLMAGILKGVETKD